MKRFLSVSLFIALMVAASAVLFSCTAGERVPDGTYVGGIAGDFGEEYTFTGKKVRVVSYMFGEIVIDYHGTYTLSEGEITFRFPEDEDGLYSRTLKFSAEEDGKSITIDGDVFRLASADDTTSAGG